jgi:AAA+ ATPase superfamily predicted ATPase
VGDILGYLIEQVLGYLIRHDALVVLDEFPLLIESDESLPSFVQRLWDHGADGTSGRLVLTGSSISMMKETVMGGGSPLHGRFDMRLQVEELAFDAAKAFFPDYDNEETVLAWSVFGGTPHRRDDGRRRVQVHEPTDGVRCAGHP